MKQKEQSSLCRAHSLPFDPSLARKGVFLTLRPLHYLTSLDSLNSQPAIASASWGMRREAQLPCLLRPHSLEGRQSRGEGSGKSRMQGGRRKMLQGKRGTNYIWPFSGLSIQEGKIMELSLD